MFQTLFSNAVPHKALSDLISSIILNLPTEVASAHDSFRYRLFSAYLIINKEYSEVVSNYVDDPSISNGYFNLKFTEEVTELREANTTYGFYVEFLQCIDVILLDMIISDEELPIYEEFLTRCFSLVRGVFVNCMKYSAYAVTDYRKAYENITRKAIAKSGDGLGLARSIFFKKFSIDNVINGKR